MSVLTAPAAPAIHKSAGPACTLQRVAPQGAPGRSASLWQLGIEAQELTTTIGQLAEQLEADDDTRAQALAELEAALLAEEHNKAALSAKADATCWVIEHLRGQAAYRQQQAKRLTELSRSDASRADALEDSLVLVLTWLEPKATRFSPITSSAAASPRRSRSTTKTPCPPSGSPTKPPASPTRPPTKKPSKLATSSPAPNSSPAAPGRIH